MRNNWNVIPAAPFLPYTSETLIIRKKVESRTKLSKMTFIWAVEGLQERRKMCALFRWENLKERDNFQDTGRDGMILNERKWLQSRTVLEFFCNNSPRNTVNLVMRK